MTYTFEYREDHMLGACAICVQPKPGPHVRVFMNGMPVDDLCIECARGIAGAAMQEPPPSEGPEMVEEELEEQVQQEAEPAQTEEKKDGEPKAHKCPECGAELKSEESLKRHLKNVHKVGIDDED